MIKCLSEEFEAPDTSKVNGLCLHVLPQLPPQLLTDCCPEILLPLHLCILHGFPSTGIHPTYWKAFSIVKESNCFIF